MAEPPVLGQVQRGNRAPVALVSMALYGAVAAGLVLLSRSTPVQSRISRSMTIALDAFEVEPAPPPPLASAAAGTQAPRPVDPVPPEPASPQRIPEEARRPPELPGTPAASGGSAAGGGGLPGGVPGGVPGGSSGSQAPGASVVPPRFDAAYLQNPEPDYPALSRRLGEEGRVLLRVLVNPDGAAEQVEIRQSSGHSRLDQAALATVKRWRFTPARRGPERLAAWVMVPLSFQLDA